MKCLNQQQMALKHYLNFKVICSSSGLRLLPHKIKSLLVHRALQKYCCMYTAAEGIFWLRLLFLNSFVKWEFECLCRLGYMKQGISWFFWLRKKNVQQQHWHGTHLMSSELHRVRASYYSACKLCKPLPSGLSPLKHCGTKPELP